MSGMWKVEGRGGIWLVRRDAGSAGVLARGDAIPRETAAARVSEWFPDGWGREQASALAAICRGLVGPFPDSAPPDAWWLRKTVAEALRDGRLTAVRMSLRAPVWSVPEGEEPQTAPTSVPETTWVEFVVLEDETNQPVEGLKLLIKLPDGARRAQATDSNGAVLLDPVRPGTCEVGCVADAPRSGTTLELVAMGRGTGSPAREPGQKVGASGLVVMNVIHHKVRTGETLDGLARANGMTWQDLARFNFDTEEPKRISHFLRGRLGCTRKTADQRNYVFSDSDQPGILLIPRPWYQKGMSTGREHVIRVRRIWKPIRVFVFSQ